MVEITSREFNRDVSAAKRKARHEPVIITDRGEPAYVLLAVEEFERLTNRSLNVVDRLSMDDDIEIDFEVSELNLQVPDL